MSGQRPFPSIASRYYTLGMVAPTLIDPKAKSEYDVIPSTSIQDPTDSSAGTSNPPNRLESSHSDPDIYGLTLQQKGIDR